MVINSKFCTLIVFGIVDLEIIFYIENALMYISNVPLLTALKKMWK